MWWEKPTNLNIRNNKLFIVNKCVEELAETNGTPLYIYNGKRVKENYSILKNALSSNFTDFKIHYAVKANRNHRLLEIIKEAGCGIDATSPGEISLAKNTGFKDNDIIFTGTSLSNRDLQYLSETEVLINFDSVSSLRRFALQEGREVGLRINTGIGLGLNNKISTGGEKSGELPVKFGLSGSSIIKALKIINNKKMNLNCIHHHVGSNWIGKENEYFKALNNLLKITNEIQTKLDYSIKVLDLGGGYGVPMTEHDTEFSPVDFFEDVSQAIHEHDLNFERILIEPGNFLVNDSGILVVQVNTVEEKHNHLFIGVDAGLNILSSPALYDIHHEIVVCGRCVDEQNQEVTVAGNICETGDLFAINRKLPQITEGDYLAILNTGAYANVMSNEYNLRPKAKEILLE